MGCGRSLLNEKLYCQRNRVCKMHVSLPELLINGMLHTALPGLREDRT